MKTLQKIKGGGCDTCPLGSSKRSRNFPAMKPTGKGDILIVGEAPGREEDKQGRQFVGPSGQVLHKALPRDARVVLDNCVRCSLTRTPTDAELIACSTHVIKHIEMMQPKAIIGTGNVPLKMLTGESKITSWRGKRIPLKIGEHVCWYFPVLHPSFILRHEGDTHTDYEKVFQDDIDAVISQADSLPAPKVWLESEALDGITGIVDDKRLQPLERLWNDSTELGFDIETTCLRPYKEGARILSLAISNGNNTIAVPFTPRVRTFFLDLLKSNHVPRLIAHNLSFEQEWILAEYKDRDLLRDIEWHDSMAQAYCIDSNCIQNLNALCLQYFGLPIKEVTGVDSTTLESMPLDRVLAYNGLDAKATYYLFQRQRDVIDKEGLSLIYFEQLRRIPTFVLAQAKGLLVDQEQAHAIKAEVESTLAKEEARLQELKTVKRFVEQHGPFSPYSPKQVLRYLKAHGHRVASTGETVLEEINTKFTRQVLVLRTTKKLLSTNVLPYCKGGKHVYPDGRIHTSYSTTFTGPGRSASSNPNVQNWPARKHGYVRTMIVVPKGYVLLSLDYKQAEICVLGMLSRDKSILAALEERRDIHGEYADLLQSLLPKIMDHPNVEGDAKRLRFLVKNSMVFASFYGSYSRSIANHAHIPPDVVIEWQEQFWDEFRGVRKWQSKTVRFYKRHRYVECLTGRRRYAPLSVNMIFNTPIQGTASDIVIDGMNRLSERRPSYQAALNIHDDLVFFVKKKNVDRALAKIVPLMLEPSFPWADVPLAVEASVGENWGEMEEVGTYYSN